MRLFLFLTILCGLPLGAEPWDAVRALRPGDRIKVQEAGGPEHKGTLAAVSAEAVSVQTGKALVVVDRSRTRRVQAHSGSRRARNIAIGAAAGLAVGLVIDGTLGAYLRNEASDKGRPLFYVAPIGLFGALGAAISPYKTVYRAK